MKCPHCGSQNNPDGSKFCMTCGGLLEAQKPTATPVIPPSVTNPPVQQPKIPPVGTRSTVPTRQSTASSVTQSPDRFVAGSNSKTIPVSVWGPFAGYGTRGRHVSWLMNDQGAKAADLLHVVKQRFQQRRIPGATVSDVTLKRRGIIVDTRPYSLVKRNLTTAGLYIASFGHDLYVSQVTYFKGPISNMRVLIAISMILFYIIYPMISRGMLDNLDFEILSGSIDGLESAMTMLCCVGPFWIVDAVLLLVAIVFSIYKFITEKDFFAILRNPPNDFDIDDMVALEKSVEETVRVSLDTIGIEQKLMPPADEYGMRRRLF